MGNTTGSSRKGCCGFILGRLFKTKFPKLLIAIKHGNLPLVKKFQKQGVNFNQHNENGDTPLHIAARYK
jgi:ankyrin repeat protein